MISLTREQFTTLAKKGNLIPVYREIIADLETPVSAYLKIDTGDHSFLLESVENGGSFARYSFLGASPSLTFAMRKGRVTITENGQSRTVDSGEDPLQELQKIMAAFKPVAIDDLPPFFGGAIGYLSYEAVTYFEKTVPRAKKDDLEVPDAYFMISDTLLIFDHLEQRIKIVANAVVSGDPGAAYDEALAKIEDLTMRLQRPVKHRVVSPQAKAAELKPEVNMTEAEYLGMAAAMQEYIRAGDIFQVVPSQRFSIPFKGEPSDLYRALRRINPSPYMFCFKFGKLAIVGSSPETHVRCADGQVEIRPIAGTYPRGENAAQDEANAREILNDPKEKAEHIMLVDLARNDVGRVCHFKTVEVTELMQVEKYSHVMHIVSHVKGQLKPEQTAYDVMRATFPAGTLSGAPKIRAMQIIAEREPTCRGTYGGALGYFGFSGNLDSAILIRTVLIKDGRAYLQAGGGLVADSTPEGEYQESLNKAKAGLKALAMAQGAL
jgi:anthranilate synthase component I